MELTQLYSPWFSLQHQRQRCGGECSLISDFDVRLWNCADDGPDFYHDHAAGKDKARDAGANFRLLWSNLQCLFTDWNGSVWTAFGYGFHEIYYGFFGDCIDCTGRGDKAEAQEVGNSCIVDAYPFGFWLWEYLKHVDKIYKSGYNKSEEIN